MLANTGMPGRGDQRWAGMPTWADASVGKCQSGLVSAFAPTRGVPTRGCSWRLRGPLRAATGLPIRRAWTMRSPPRLNSAACSRSWPPCATRPPAVRGTRSRPSTPSRPTRSRKPMRSPTRSPAAISHRSPTNWAICCSRSSITRAWPRRPAGSAFADVARAISDKMIRRHPHVFGDAAARDAAAQTAAWEAQKSAERAAARKPARWPACRSASPPSPAPRN